MTKYRSFCKLLGVQQGPNLTKTTTRKVANVSQYFSDEGARNYRTEKEEDERNCSCQSRLWPGQGNRANAFDRATTIYR